MATFNNEPFEAVNDSVMTGSKKTVKMLLLGNSLTYCDVPDEEPNKTHRGLATTAVSKDYVHQLTSMVAKRLHCNVKFSLLNIAEFERTFMTHPFLFSKLAKAKFTNPDILIVQIGENVDAAQLENPAKFEKEYLHLLSFFPNSMRIVTLPFWPDKRKQYAITDVAIRSKSFLVDLGHLGDGNDPENFASSQKTYHKPGVGEHPGDVGMKRIADCYFAVINASRRD